jgi:hypothetical protein
MLLGGCTEPPCPTNDAAARDSCLAQAFDPAATGTIRGRVCWEGAVPITESTEVRVLAYHNALHKNPVRHQTPHIPRVNAANDGVADAVVFLRGIDPCRSKPWDHADVRIEFRDRQMCMSQGDQPTNAGFIRRGDKVVMINHDADFHALRGRGANFFTLPLIKAEQPATETLRQSGVVELFDAAGYYWLHAHLLVVEHPYYARTDANGNFALENVPAGDYEVVGWLPSWIVTRKEIDPETAVVVRQAWAAPQEQRQPVKVQAGQTESLTFRWSQEMFRISGK